MSDAVGGHRCRAIAVPPRELAAGSKCRRNAWRAHRVFVSGALRPERETRGFPAPPLLTRAGCLGGVLVWQKSEIEYFGHHRPSQQLKR
jgi:hypothetical protein